MSNTPLSPKISLIIPVYNTAPYLPACLESVTQQTFSDIEIICINDGSTDDSLRILTEASTKDNRIKIINQKNSGVVNARNNAIAIAQGEYIFPLDSDDLIAPDCLEILFNFANKNPQYAIIAPSVKLFGAIESILRHPQPSTWNMIAGNCLVNAALFKKELWVKYGGYDTRFSDGLEDYDFWMNFIQDKQKIIRLPQIIFFYRIKEKSESRNMASAHLHKNLHQLMTTKYPVLRFHKISKITRRIIHIFFREKATNENIIVKIIGIPIFRRRT